MRDLNIIISKMLDHVPTDHDEVRYLGLRSRLEQIRDQAKMTAPEGMAARWGDVGETLHSYLPHVVADRASWQTLVVNIYMTWEG